MWRADRGRGLIWQVCDTVSTGAILLKRQKRQQLPQWLLLFPTSPPRPPGNTRLFPPRHPERMADGDITDGWLQRHQRLGNKTRVKEQLMLVCYENKEVHRFLDFVCNIWKVRPSRAKDPFFSGGGTARHSVCVCVCVFGSYFFLLLCILIWCKWEHTFDWDKQAEQVVLSCHPGLSPTAKTGGPGGPGPSTSSLHVPSNPIWTEGLQILVQTRGWMFWLTAKL